MRLQARDAEKRKADQRIAAATGAFAPAVPPRGVRVSKIGKFCKILQIFGGLVLGCIKTKFCKKICV